MLEMISFNNNQFRYRAETSEYGIIYNLRYGNLYIVNGNTKSLVEDLIVQGSSLVNTDNKAIAFLIKNKVFLKKEYI